MNHLAAETSPYLRDHASQPVDWYPWGEEALERARAENKPIFLSIGYSACHWCHVMARESFSDPKIAEQLNKDFISIKVDREERPDLDEIYIEAVRLMNSTAGWPLSVFLTPELKPFYGGTYFPPEARSGIASFTRVLSAVIHYYRTERHEIDESANRIVAELTRLSTLAVSEGELDGKPLREYYRQRLEVFDSEHGGFGVAPKFPNPTDMSLLLRLSLRPDMNMARHMVELTLHKMAEGGIYDQLGGGFHRYATDTIWLVPHFEKMLYDNALLAVAYAEAWATTGEDFYRTIAVETLDYMTRELATPEGGFRAAQDADTGGREGSRYTWTLEQLTDAVGPELAPLAADFYGVSEPGHFDGTNVPHVGVPVEVLLQAHNLDLDGLWTKLAEVKAKMLGVRNRRPALRTDAKVLADWNGLALSALAVCGRLFEDERLISRARDLAAFLTGPMMDGDNLLHVRREGLPGVNGQLSDYAFVTQGLLDLYEADFDITHIEAALNLTDRMVALFAAPDSGFFTTAADATGLIARLRSGFDGAIPSGNSVAVSNLLRLARLTGRNELERQSVATLRGFKGLIDSYPMAFTRMLAALDLLLHPGPEVALFLPGDSDEGRAMLDLLRSRDGGYRTAVVVKGEEPDAMTSRLIPVTRERRAIEGRPTAYVCRKFTCAEPVQTAEKLAQLLEIKEDS